MGFGSSSPPKPQPVTPVPQEDDPKALEERRKAAVIAANQQGTSAHLLSGESGVTEDPGVDKRKLLGSSSSTTA